FDPAAGRLEVRLRQRAAVPGPDVTAEMTLPPVELGGAAYREGTLRGKLSPKGDELLLFAEGVRGPEEARFAVGVDGWARAFGFRATLTARGGAALPEVLQAPAIRLRVGPYAEAGPAFTVPVEVDGAPPGAAVEVALGRLSGGEFREEQSSRRDGGRDDRVGFALVGKDLLFEASSKDWTVPLDVSRIRGPRTLRARLVAAGGRELARDERGVTLGDQAPDGVRFINAPLKAWNKAPLALEAAGGDAVVGVKEAFFFVGKPAAGKLPEGAVKVPAVAKGVGGWAAAVPMPADKKGPTDVSVGVVNAVGLTAFATTSIDLADDDPEKSKPATVKGRLLEGERPQPGIDVVMTDEKGAEKGRATTDEDGAYAFKGVAPGKYRLSATKRTRRASHPRTPGTFEVAPGATVTADLVLFL
ncbi:MAG: carboxypeptidase regulatory-like domain-containing protein, partial [Gemmataceae bacterium]